MDKVNQYTNKSSIYNNQSTDNTCKFSIIQILCK